MSVQPLNFLCVTSYSGVTIYVDSPYVVVWGVWCSFPENSTLHVFSIVLVCGCDLTLCLREVFFVLFFCLFVCFFAESSNTNAPHRDTVSHCNKPPVVMVCFKVFCVKVIPHVHHRVFSYQSCNRVWVGSV